MGRTLGAKNKPKADIIKSDDYANAVMGTGTSRDRSAYNKPITATLLDRDTLQDLYIGDGFARKIIDLVPEEMVRSGFEIEGLKDEKLEEAIESKIEGLNALKQLADAVRWSRLTGGSIIVFGLNDGGALDVEINIDGVQDIEFIRVYDRYQATTFARETNPQLAAYGDPIMWEIYPATGSNYKVHNSRVHVFDGEPLPDFKRASNDGWGASALQACYTQLVRLGMAHQHANSCLERSQQAVHSIPNLAATLEQPGGTASVQKRVDVVDMVRGILNTIVVDALEGYTVQSTSLGGIPELIDRFAEALAAVANIPVSLLLGRSPGGLNSTGKSELDGFYARIESMQNDILREPLDKIVQFILISLGVKSGTPYTIKFNPLVVMSDLDTANIEKIEAETEKLKQETATGYVEIGALDQTTISKKIEKKYADN